MPLETLSTITLAVINSSKGALVITENDTEAMEISVFVADEPAAKLIIAFLISPCTAFPVVKSKDPFGQPVPLEMVGVPNTELL